MKRISVFAIVMLMVVPGTTKARYYTSLRCRIRYSPYAFNYRHSGLVPGNVRYSPYASNYRHSGLVSENVRYCPYAFSYRHSGLIADYCCHYYWPCYCSHAFCCRDLDDCDTPCSACASNHKASNSFDEIKKSYGEKLKAHREKVKQLRDSRKEINITRQKNGKEIICSYLKSKNIGDFETDRLLKIDNKTISVNFLFRDKNLIIKYWNPEEIQSLAHQPRYKRNFCEKYEQTWRNFCEKYEDTGGKVYQIKSANEKEILAKLELCHELNDG